MNGRSFLDVANQLLGGVEEADWRSAVSRAYYAAFHVARTMFRSWGFAVAGGERAHAYLWLRLSNAGHPLVDQAGRSLAHLRSRRNWADYDIDQPFPETTAVHSVQLAEDGIQLLDQLPTSPPVQQQVIDAIRTYERDVLREVTWTDPAAAP